MSKWAFALAVAVVVGVGCAGGGGGTGTGTGTGTGGTDSTAFVTIPNVPGVLTSVFLTGQGRAQGDQIAIIRRVVVDDTAGPVQTILNPVLRLHLNGYTQNSARLNVPTTVGRTFDHYDLEIQELDLDNGDGTFSQVGVGNNQPFVAQQFPAYFTILPGRETSMSVRIDDSMFDPLNGYAFNAGQFQTVNFSINGLDPSRMNGFLSDYVQFDLSNVTPGGAGNPLPPFPDGSGFATALYINGDNFAIGTLPPGAPDQAPPTAVPFYVLTPIGYVPGTDVGPRTAVNPATGQSTLIPGTYSVVQPDPRNPLNPASMITALVGSYKNYPHVLNSVGNNPQGFEIVAFPGTYTDDPAELDYGKMDIVLFNVSGGAITKMYFGQMDVNAGTINAWPIAQVTNPQNTANQISGTVSGFDSNTISHIHSGRYTLNAANLPATFSTSGRFIVYRR